METKQPTPAKPRLAQLLETHDLTQRTLATAIDVSEGVVNRWVREEHKPIRPYRQAIAKHFGLKEEEIAWKER